MERSTRRFVVALCAGALATGLTGFARQAAPRPLGALVVPAGFTFEVFAENVENARMMALGPQGTVFVGSQFAGKVYAVVDRDGDHKADRVLMIASGLSQPNGVAMRNGALYVATTSKILRFDDIEKHLDAPPAPVMVRDNLPNPNPGHTWKFIAFGPDDLLYMSVGAPCNVCLSPPMVVDHRADEARRIELEVFAEGVRNSVGFDWHPATHELWFTDNGRDMLGDDVPDDELNVAYKAGPALRLPVLPSGRRAGPASSARSAPAPRPNRPCRSSAPTWRRSASRSTPAPCFPRSYKNAVIIAQHGSWNRSLPSGYRVMVAHTDGRRVTSYEPLRGRLHAGRRDPVLPAGAGAGGSHRPAGRCAATARRIDPDQRRHRQSSHPRQLRSIGEK